MFDNFSGRIGELVQFERRRAMTALTMAAGWVALLTLAGVTGVHAVSVVLEHQTAAAGGWLAAIRIAAPLLVEVVAVIVAAGFALHMWRGGQRIAGIAIELLWLVFASLNMLAAFTLDGGAALPPALDAWVGYGLPLSALLTGAGFYVLLRLDPDAARAIEQAAAYERTAAEAFEAKMSVLMSAEMANVTRQRAWLDTVNHLRGAGYTDAQIEYMLRATPALRDAARQAEPAPELLASTPRDEAWRLPEDGPAPEVVRGNGAGGGHSADNATFRGGGDK